jgi:beta-lactamase superfamily II metal-dependent hydrolase
METFSVTMLPGNEGDCLWIEYGHAAKPHRILIDGGRKSTYGHLRPRLAALPADQRQFELLVITHIDRDHIEGVLEILGDPAPPVKFKDIWFNGYDHLVAATAEPFGVVQGEKLTALLSKPGTPWNEAFDRGPVVCRDGAAFPQVTLDGNLELTVISPTVAKLSKLLVEWENVCRKEGIVPGHAFEPEEGGDEPFGVPDVNLFAQEEFVGDTAEANGSSIAMIAQFGGKRVLLGADAHPDVVEAAMTRVAGASAKARFDAVKLAHHGSSHNTSNPLLAKIDCDTWLFSTNGSFFHHPSPSAVARVIKHGAPKTLAFNYRSDESGVWDAALLRGPFGYSTRYPDPATPGILKLELLA